MILKMKGRVTKDALTMPNPQWFSTPFKDPEICPSASCVAWWKE